jgi:hypothetical protein
MTGSCEACGYTGIVDRAHIKSKGSGGSMDDCNIMLLCREHHQQQHRLGWKKFCEKYPLAMTALVERGWYFAERFGIWKLERDVA